MTGEDLKDKQNRPRLGDDLINTGNRQQLSGDFGKSEVFCIPWGHHKLLIDKCKGNPEKALFYVHKTIENNCSRENTCVS
mgnify:CR=1 FL=1